METERKQQTAVEWLEAEFVKLEETVGVHGVMYELIEKAKEMEKEQMEKAIHFGYLSNDDDDFKGIDYFYEVTFNEGKNICPNCRQGVLRMERPGKIGCSVC
jgi:hypothetical protein